MQTIQSKPFTPSSLQLSIGAFTRDPAAGNLIIEAGAGCGKTSTICWVLSCLPRNKDGSPLPQKITFLAFNKNIADELKSRVPSHVSCATFHSAGFRALKSILPKDVKVESGKCRKMVWSRLEKDDPDTSNIMRLVSLAKSAGLLALDSAPSVPDLANTHSIPLENPNQAERVVMQVLQQSNNDLSCVDFDDMLYLSVKLNAPFTPQDWIFVDEAQDTNSLQLEMLRRMYRDGASRFVAVGDPLQAIYGFRGADHTAMDRIAETFRCTTLPLDVSYRCPKTVVKEAQRVIESYNHSH